MHRRLSAPVVTGTRIATLAVFVLALLLEPARVAYAAVPNPADAPERGLWQTEKRDGVFEIRPCGAGLCGWLVGMDYEGAVPQDSTGRSQCGLEMLTDFLPADDGKWEGHILDPRSEDVYQARIWMSDPETLKLRGFVLGIPLLGETRIWRRYHGGPIGAACKLPSAQ